MAGELNEKCAVAGAIVSEEGEHAAPIIYDELFALQHRGSEFTGIASDGEGHIQTRREAGFVLDVYQPKHMKRLIGQTAIGHNRYSTSGSKKRHAQPVKDSEIGFAFAHNGNLPVTEYLETQLSTHNINTDNLNDSEMMGHAIAQLIRGGQDLPNAVKLVQPYLKGAYSCVAMHDGMVVAFRDRRGIRPLELGVDDGLYTAVSETCALDIVGAKHEGIVNPGEMVILTKDGIEREQLSPADPKLDMFEFVYFARHDSILYGERVNEVRRRFGEQLAEQHHPLNTDTALTLVVPVPDTSIPVAEGYAEALGLQHRQSIIKNRYIGRTFMQPSQRQRRQQLRRKHTIIPEDIAGRDIVMIDDSIVRMNTLPRLVEQMHEAGAKSVQVLISSPPVRFPDFYGIDTPSQDNLAAANLTTEQMRKQIGCNYLGFLSLSRMVTATKSPESAFNLSAFTGEYPIDIGAMYSRISTPVELSYLD